MKEIKENEYKCALCQKKYSKGWSDEEVEKEVKEIWGDIPHQERAVICDDCFNYKKPQEIKAMGNEYKFIKKYIPFILPWLEN